MNSIKYRIAQLEDVEMAHQLAIKQNFPHDFDLIEVKMAVWDSHYRIEALNHYFKSGWSFVAVNSDNEVVGFFMGQALLFLEKQTQSLWVEYICTKTNEVATELIEIAYKLAREKHFQRVLFSKKTVDNLSLSKSFPFQKWERENIFLKTTK